MNKKLTTLFLGVSLFMAGAASSNCVTANSGLKAPSTLVKSEKKFGASPVWSNDEYVFTEEKDMSRTTRGETNFRLWKASDGNFVSIPNWGNSHTGFSFEFKFQNEDASAREQMIAQPFSGNSAIISPPAQSYMFQIDGTTHEPTYYDTNKIGQVVNIGGGWYRYQCHPDTIPTSKWSDGGKSLTLDSFNFQWVDTGGTGKYWNDLTVRNMKTFTYDTAPIFEIAPVITIDSSHKNILNSFTHAFPIEENFFNSDTKVLSLEMELKNQFMVALTDEGGNAVTNNGNGNAPGGSKIIQDGVCNFGKMIRLDYPNYPNDFNPTAGHGGWVRWEISAKEMREASGFITDNTKTTFGGFNVPWAGLDYCPNYIKGFQIFDSYSFEVTFNIDGTETKKIMNGVVTEPDNKVDISGKHIEGWYTDDLFTSESLYDFSTSLTADIVLYAKLEDHNLTHIDSQSATCEDSGHEEYWVCDDCGKYFKDEDGLEEIEDLEAWLGEDGEGYIAPCGHTYVKNNEVDSTCTTPGTREYWSCTDCDKKWSDENKEDLIENFDAWKSEGGDGYIELKQHGYNGYQKTEKVLPTCENAGCEEYYKCSECGIYAEDSEFSVLIGDDSALATWKSIGGDGYIDPTGHELEIKRIHKDPTCTEVGEAEYYQCSLCGLYFEDESAEFEIGDSNALETWLVTTKEGTQSGGILPKAPHTLEHFDGDPATCKDAGYKECYVCTTCENYFEDELGNKEIGDSSAYQTWIQEGGEGYIQPTGEHNLELKDAVNPTCCTPGHEAYYECVSCNDCFEDQEKTKPIDDIEAWLAEGGDGYIAPTDEHTLVKVAEVAATCTTPGCSEYWTCSVCGAVFKDSEGKNLIADLDAWKTGEGKIPAKGHTVVHHEKVEPTETTEGSKEYWECSECHKYFEDEACTQEITEDIETWKVIPMVKKPANVGLILGIVIPCVVLVTGGAVVLGIFLSKKKKKLQK